MGLSSSSATQTPQIPDELKPLFRGVTQGTTAMQQALPLTQFTGYYPRGVADLGNLTKWGLEDIPALRAVQPGVLGAFAAGATLPEVAARPWERPTAESGQYNLLDTLVGGPIGASPATLAGMQAWEGAVKPVVQQEMGLAGLGRSGELLEAMGQSATQAYVPLVQQEIDNRKTAIDQLGQMANAEMYRDGTVRAQTLDALRSQLQEFRALAETMYGQQEGAIKMALAGGDITTKKRQEQLDAAYDEFLRLQALAEGATYGPLGQVISSSIGSKMKGKSQSIDLGQIMSMAAGMAAGSDERIKADVAPASDEAALAGIRRLPVASWRYQDGTRRHTGPMAQDYERSFGPQVSVGGVKQIDLGDWLGQLTAATQALARHVDRLGVRRG